MNVPMNILQVNSGMGWSGGQYQILLLSRGLRKRGHHVVVACPKETALAEKAALNGIPAEPVSMRGQWDLSAVYKLYRVIKRHGIQIVNTDSPTSHTLALMAVLLAKRIGMLSSGRLPVLVATRRVSFPLRRHPFRWIKWVWGVDRFIAVAKNVRRSLIQSGVSEKKVVTIYGGVDHERFCPAAASSEARQELGLDDDALVVGKVGDYRRWKGHETFLKAAGLILAENPKVRFLVIGDKSGCYPAILDLARRLGIERYVLFAGFREDVERFYPIMTVSVNCATEGEGIPGVLRESLAMEIPVVATDVGGNNELVINGKTGFLIPPHDPKVLAQAILRLLRDPKQCRTIGQNGCKWVKERFSVDAMVTQTEVLYQEALNVNR
jgi:glycosyltransferase involved in cell wall biosynthesis